MRSRLGGYVLPRDKMRNALQVRSAVPQELSTLRRIGICFFYVECCAIRELHRYSINLNFVAYSDLGASGSHVWVHGRGVESDSL